MKRIFSLLIITSVILFIVGSGGFIIVQAIRSDTANIKVIANFINQSSSEPAAVDTSTMMIVRSDIAGSTTTASSANSGGIFDPIDFLAASVAATQNFFSALQVKLTHPAIQI